MIATKNEILEFIPQRQPVVMIDNLVASDEIKTVSDFRISMENIFCENGFLNESGLTENIAQTAAARAGYECFKNKVPVPVGYIAAIKDLHIHQLPKVNSDISTQIEITNKIFDITIIKGKVFQAEKLLAECEMRIIAITK